MLLYTVFEFIFPCILYIVCISIQSELISPGISIQYAFLYSILVDIYVFLYSRVFHVWFSSEQQPVCTPAVPDTVAVPVPVPDR